MSFEEGAGLDTSQVTGGGGGGRGGVVIGGGIGTLIIILLGAFFGVDLSGVVPSGTNPLDPGNVTTGGQESSESFNHCKTGADANRDDTCRIIGTVNSVQAYWNEALPADQRRQYRAAKTVIFSGVTQSACGTASSQTGPFYCPADERVYIDASFFDTLTQRFGADDGALAQEYVVAHEYGHHIENILGVLGQAQDGRTGPQSGGVRVELMADCFAGVWAHHASRTVSDTGTPFLKPLTENDIRSALSAAAAVGDDHIQQATQGQVNPHQWTHGSSEQRQRWFITGYKSGTSNSCDTFSTNQL
jgi:predicted metalloprotease